MSWTDVVEETDGSMTISELTRKGEPRKPVTAEMLTSAITNLKKERKAKADAVNSPAHYTDGGIETIDYIEAKSLNYHLGNVVKYVSRAGKKDAMLVDLEKAQWYLTREIARLKEKSNA